MCDDWFSAQHEDITTAMRDWLRSSNDGPRAAAILALGILSPPGFDAEDHLPMDAESAGPAVDAALFVLSGFDDPHADCTREHFAEPFLRSPTPEMLRALVDLTNQYRSIADPLSAASRSCSTACPTDADLPPKHSAMRAASGPASSLPYWRHGRSTREMRPCSRRWNTPCTG